MQRVAESEGNNIVRYKFSKSERLCSRKEIDRLFDSGASFNVYPLKLVFIRRDAPAEIPAQTMFVVPKRNFKKANHRNLLKRRMREAFRHTKSALYADLKQKNVRLSMAFLFTGRKEEDYAAILKCVQELITRLGSKI